MADLQQIRLGEVSQIYSGFAFRSQDLGEIGIPVIKIANIQNKRVSPECGDHLPEELCTPKLNRYFLQPEDTLIAMTGAGSVGKVGKMPSVEGRFLVNQRVAIVRPDSSQCSAAFVYYALSQDIYETKLYSLGLGAGQPNVSAKQIGELEIPFPPLPVQQRIAGILSAYDELIENNQRRIKILESMARALYREWFVNFRFPGHESVPRVPSPFGEIPQVWEVKKLGDIAEDVRRNIPKGELEEPTPYVGLEHIPRRSLALDDWETATALGSNKLAFKKGEVLFGKIRPYFHKVSVAPFDGLCSADTIVIRARRPEHYATVVACVSSDAFVAEASATANGAKMPRANWDVLEKFPVVISKGEVAERFSALFTDIISQQQALVFQTQNLRRTRDLLLPRLLSGQIDITAVDESQSPNA
jgi:type I restriction enzyme S subunit